MTAGYAAATADTVRAGKGRGRVVRFLLPALLLPCMALCLSAADRLRPDGLNYLTLRSLGMPALETGDVILRQGLGIDSAIIARLTDSEFSHVGIVAETEPEIKIIHATTDDHAREPDQVIASPVAEFISNARALAVKRYKLNPEQKERLRTYLKEQLGHSFVLRPGEGSDTLYCSTLVKHALQQGGVPSSAEELALQYIDFAAVEGWYLFPESFLQDRRSTLLFYFVPGQSVLARSPADAFRP